MELSPGGQLFRLALNGRMVLAIILFVALFVRVLPRVILKEALCNDTYFHLGFSRLIRQHHGRLPHTSPRFLLPHSNTYPWFLHWLLSLLPDRQLFWVERWISAACDCLQVLCAYYFAGQILALYAPPFDPKTAALWCAAFMSVAPPFLRVAVGPRAYQATARTLGELLFLVYAGFLSLFILTHHFWYVLPAIGAVAVLVITSKFANQVVVLFGLVFLIFGYPSPLLVAMAGFGLCLVITRGRAFTVLQGQWKHSQLFCRNCKRFFHKNQKTFLVYRKRLTKHLAHPVRFVLWFFEENHFLHLLVSSYPHLLVLGVQWVLLPAASQGAAFHRLQNPLVLLFLASLLVFGLVNIFYRYLFVIGEAERYLEYSLFAQYLLFVASCLYLGRPEVLSVLLAYSLVSTPFHIRRFIQVYAPLQKQHQQLIPMLQALDTENTVFYCIGNLHSLVFFATQKAKIVYHSINMGAFFDKQENYDYYYGHFPLAGVPVGEIIAKHGVTHVVTSQAFLMLYQGELNDKSFEQGRYKIENEAGDFVIFKTDFTAEPARCTEHTP